MQDIHQQKIAYWPVMITLFIGAFLVTLGTSAINLALMDVMKYFDTDLDTVKWTLTGFMLATGTVAPITGYLGERYSYKRLYLLSTIGFTLSSILCAISWNILSLIGFRILQGVFAGMTIPATMTIIYQVIPEQKRAVAISLWSAASMFAPAVGPALSGWLIESFNWQAIFIFNVPIGIIAIVMIIKFTPYYKLSKAKSFDYPGFVTGIVASMLLLFAFSEGANWGWTSWRILVLFALGGLVLFLFVKRELTAKLPALDLRVLKYKSFSICVVIRGLIYMSLFSGTVLTPMFLQNIKQLTPLEAGMVMLWPSLAMVLVMIIVGRLYHRFDSRVLIIVGVLAMGYGSYKMGRLTMDTSNLYVIFNMAIRNVGIAIASMPATNTGMIALPREKSGNGSSINNWLTQAIASLSIGIFTSLLSVRADYHIVNLMSSKNVTTSDVIMRNQAFVMGVNDVYVIAAIIVLIAIPISLFLKKGNGTSYETDLIIEKDVEIEDAV